MSKEAINTHHMIVDFGKHKGELYTRIPVNYLLWMVNTNHSRVKFAKAELDRRGTALPEIDVSGHAIDRASILCRKIWHHTKADAQEGLHAWLCRVGKEAIEVNDTDNAGRYLYLGMKFVFVQESEWPVMKTVMLDSKNRLRFDDDWRCPQCNEQVEKFQMFRQDEVAVYHVGCEQVIEYPEGWDGHKDGGF